MDSLISWYKMLPLYADPGIGDVWCVCTSDLRHNVWSHSRTEKMAACIHTYMSTHAHTQRQTLRQRSQRGHKNPPRESEKGSVESLIYRDAVGGNHSPSIILGLFSMIHETLWDFEVQSWKGSSGSCGLAPSLLWIKDIDTQEGASDLPNG